MKRFLMATGAVSLFIAATLLQVFGGNGHEAGVTSRPSLLAKSNEEPINSPSLRDIEMIDKRLAVFKKILPHPPRRILVLYSTPKDEAAVTEARLAGEKLAITVIERRIESVPQLEAELHHIQNDAVDGIFHIPDTWIDRHLDLIFREARGKKVPIMTFAETYVAQGALASYTRGDSGSMAARCYLTLNLETARQIGMTFSAQALKRADKTIDRDSETGDGYER